MIVKRVERCTEHTVRIADEDEFDTDCLARAIIGEKQVMCDECELWVWSR